MRNTATPDDPGLRPARDGARLFARLHDDHLDIADRIAALVGDTEAGRRDPALAGFESLVRSLERHLVAEEATIYPALREVGLLVSFAERMTIQHDVIRSAVDGARDALHAGGGTEAAALRYLQQVVADHVEEEEGSLFAYARANLGGELDALATELERVEASQPAP